MTLIPVSLVFLVSSALAADVREAERGAAKAQQQYYEALRAGNPADPARAAALRKQHLAPANSKLSGAVIESRKEIFRRLDEDNRQVVEARKRGKVPGGATQASGAGTGSGARNQAEAPEPARDGPALDGSKIEKVVDMKDASSKPRWKKASSGPPKAAANPENVVRQTDEKGVEIIEFGGGSGSGGPQKKAE